jgi:hypothetical protein
VFWQVQSVAVPHLETSFSTCAQLMEYLGCADFNAVQPPLTTRALNAIDPAPIRDCICLICRHAEALLTELPRAKSVTEKVRELVTSELAGGSLTRCESGCCKQCKRLRFAM